MRNAVKKLPNDHSTIRKVFLVNKKVSRSIWNSQHREREIDWLWPGLSAREERQARDEECRAGAGREQEGGQQEIGREGSRGGQECPGPRRAGI